MIPMRTSTIFRNRWWALLWAAGILWFAYDVAGTSPQAEDGTNAVATDATGAPVTADDEQRLAQAINSI
ncbi:MAG: hypothetical protein ABR588_06415 [Sphingomicrobium sp.]|nr:hypothetical protein [Sphingomonadales bacterium]